VAETRPICGPWKLMSLGWRNQRSLGVYARKL
jgi:hypothetical protein